MKQLRRFVMMLGTVLALVAGCVNVEADPSQGPSTALNTPIAAEPAPAEVTTMPAETLLAELQQALLAAVGEQNSVSPDQLQITTAKAVDWPDACLGIAEPDVFCAQMITPGWVVTVTDGENTWRYHTDLDMLQVKLGAVIN